MEKHYFANCRRPDQLLLRRPGGSSDGGIRYCKAHGGCQHCQRNAALAEHRESARLLGHTETTSRRHARRRRCGGQCGTRKCDKSLSGSKRFKHAFLFETRQALTAFAGPALSPASWSPSRVESANSFCVTEESSTFAMFSEGDSTPDGDQDAGDIAGPANAVRARLV